jgi:hypothetical protein
VAGVVPVATGVLEVAGVLEVPVSAGAGKVAASTTLGFASALPAEPPPPQAARSTADAQAVLILRNRKFSEHVFEIINIAFHIGLTELNKLLLCIQNFSRITAIDNDCHKGLRA